MGLTEKLKETYSALFRRMDGGSEDAGGSGNYADSGVLDDVNDLSAATMASEEAMLRSLDPEMRGYISSTKGERTDTPLPPRVIPLNLLTDAPTGTQIAMLLGMIRWAMDDSAKNGSKHEISLTIENRNGSPLLVGMGDVSIPRIAVQDSFSIGG